MSDAASDHVRIATIADYGSDHPSHRSADEALAHAANALGLELEVEWFPTTTLDGDAIRASLRGSNGILATERTGMAEQSDRSNPWIGRELFDANGLKIGTVGGLGLPRRKFGTIWLLVETAAGDKVPVPLIGIRSSGDRLVLPYPKAYVESGPTVAHEGPLSQAELRRLALHYGFDDELPGAASCAGCGLCRAGRRAGRAR